MQEETKETKRRFSAFQITCMVLVGILLVVIIVQIGIMVNLKQKTEELYDKNDNLPVVDDDESETEFEWSVNFLSAINDFERSE